MPVVCLVPGCKSRYNKDPDEVNFFTVPAVLGNNYACSKYAAEINDLSRRRRDRWIAALNRNDLTEFMLRYQKVCSKHFVTGRPALLKDESHVDWVPSQNMGAMDKSVGKIEEGIKKHPRVNRRQTGSMPTHGCGPKCYVVFCKNRRSNKNGLAFYRITSKRYDSWMRAIGRNPEKERKNSSIGHNAICSEHFSADSFANIGSNRILKDTAVPTLNLKPSKPSFSSFFHLNPNIKSPLQVTTTDNVMAAKYSTSNILVKPDPNQFRNSVINLISHLPRSQDFKTGSVSDENITAKDEEFNPDESLTKNDNKSKIENTSNSKRKSRKRYSVRMWHNYYICPKKQKNKFDMIRTESKKMQTELKMATFSIKTLARDVNRLAERVNDLTDIVKLYIQKPSPPSTLQ